MLYVFAIGNRLSSAVGDRTVLRSADSSRDSTHRVDAPGVREREREGGRKLQTRILIYERVLAPIASREHLAENKRLRLAPVGESVRYLL